MPKRLPWMSLLAASWLLSACPAPEPDDGDGIGDEGTTAGTTGETGTDTDTDTDTGVTWDEVPCGANTCVSPAICVRPGTDCNYAPCEQGMDAEWIYYEPFCAFIPADCAVNDGDCMAKAFCVLENGTFSNGLLYCDHPARDCFC